MARRFTREDIDAAPVTVFAFQVQVKDERMQSKRFMNGWVFPGITIGGSSGSQPLSVVVLTVIIVLMAGVTIYQSMFASPLGPDPNQKIPFKCLSCGEIVSKTLGELREMTPMEPMGPMAGPMKLVCPKCGKKELTQAVECPNCGNVFVFEMGPMQGPESFNDKCPKCGVSYSAAWQEKYRNK